MTHITRQLSPLPFVSPALISVTPAEAGVQGKKRDLASGKAVTPPMCRALPWFPAFAGMTEKEGKMKDQRSFIDSKSDRKFA